MKVEPSHTAIAFVADLSFLPQFCVALLSFVKYNRDYQNFFLFSNDISENDLKHVRQNLSELEPKASLELVHMKDDDFQGFHSFWNRHGRQVFYRFKIPDLLPKRFLTTIYLDVDTVCLAKFENIDLGQFPIAAVKDSISDVLAPKRGLAKYFNSGFLVINNEYWRENQISKKLFSVNPPKRLFADQDILNHFFKNKWKELPNDYNYPAARLPFRYIFRDVRKLGVKVLHFSGPIKPWTYWMKGSLNYWKDINRTQFRANNLTIIGTIKNSILHKLSKHKKSVAS